MAFGNGDATVLCRSMENWQRIRGQNLAFCLADEIDTSPAETAQKASEMMLARMRAGNVNQLAVASIWDQVAIAHFKKRPQKINV